MGLISQCVAWTTHLGYDKRSYSADAARLMSHPGVIRKFIIRCHYAWVSLTSVGLKLSEVAWTAHLVQDKCSCSTEPVRLMSHPEVMRTSIVCRCSAWASPILVWPDYQRVSRTPPPGRNECSRSVKLVKLIPHPGFIRTFILQSHTVACQ